MADGSKWETGHVVLELHLLGRPTVLVDGEPVRLRGTKAWALLGYLLRADRPVARARLARVLFADAADPDGALRWNLSHLRRMLGVELEGDPLRWSLPANTWCDLQLLTSGDAQQAVELPGVDDGFLCGLRVVASDEFRSWLDGERRHLAKLLADVRREAALLCLGGGDTTGAIALAELVAAHDPLDEHAAALLVRCLHAGARHDDARAVAAESSRRIRDELGMDPGGAIWRALAPTPGGNPLATGPVAVIAQLEAGQAAINAGASETGMAALRAAVVAARAVSNPRLLARSLVALGNALIHVSRACDDAVALLHEALPLAEAAGDHTLVATIQREIGYVDFLRGGYERSWVWFARALQHTDDPASRGWIAVYEASGRDDVGQTAVAYERLQVGLDAARSAGNIRLEAYAQTMLGRSQLNRLELADAADTFQTALRLARACDWTGHLPFPESMLADTLRRMGQLVSARQHAEHATVLADHVGDACYQASSRRALSLVHIDQGDLDTGLGLLRDVPDFCRRLPDVYRWMQAWSVDAVAEVTTMRGLDESPIWIARLESIASSYGMRPFLDHARTYRERGLPRGRVTTS
jgi:DNA-binding SARP family transcriptional activator